MLFVVLAGCQGTTADIVPVSGRVTLGGQPLAGAVVTFQPVREVGGPPPKHAGSVGKTDAEGRYELRLIERDAPGACVGKHRVTITTAKAPEGNDAQLASGERVPLAWRDGSKTLEVPPEGTTKADFEIP
jgi:hypothetical protein